jgi:hypothetical protein
LIAFRVKRGIVNFQMVHLLKMVQNGPKQNEEDMGLEVVFGLTP